MNEGGWVASDATEYSLEDKRPDWHSLVSVAISVSDIAEFNEHYTETISEKCERHGIPIRHPVIKNEDLNRWCADWERKSVRNDIVVDLLQIHSIETIQITETSLHSKWVTVFSGEEDKKRRIRSEEYIEQYLQPYYNIVSIWEYLRKSDGRPTTEFNVVTDDFSGKVSPAWVQVGEMAEKLVVVPKGDQTYPILSLADLVMELVKQEVDDWRGQAIYEYLRTVTPDDSAFVDVDGINDDEDLAMISPHKTNNINTTLHYPHPRIYLQSDKLGSSQLSSLDFYRHALAYARKNNGCVKMFNESQDRDYMSNKDILICIDGDTDQYSYIDDYNDEKRPIIVDGSGALDLFSDEIDGLDNDGST